MADDSQVGRFARAGRARWFTAAIGALVTGAVSLIILADGKQSLETLALVLGSAVAGGSAGFHYNERRDQAQKRWHERQRWPSYDLRRVPPWAAGALIFIGVTWVGTALALSANAINDPSAAYFVLLTFPLLAVGLIGCLLMDAFEKVPAPEKKTKSRREQTAELVHGIPNIVPVLVAWAGAFAISARDAAWGFLALIVVAIAVLVVLAIRKQRRSGRPT